MLEWIVPFGKLALVGLVVVWVIELVIVAVDKSRHR